MCSVRDGQEGSGGYDDEQVDSRHLSTHSGKPSSEGHSRVSSSASSSTPPGPRASAHYQASRSGPAHRLACVGASVLYAYPYEIVSAERGLGLRTLRYPTSTELRSLP